MLLLTAFFSNRIQICVIPLSLLPNRFHFDIFPIVLIFNLISSASCTFISHYSPNQSSGAQKVTEGSYRSTDTGSHLCSASLHAPLMSSSASAHLLSGGRDGKLVYRQTSLLLFVDDSHKISPLFAFDVLPSNLKLTMLHIRYSSATISGVQDRPKIGLQVELKMSVYLKEEGIKILGKSNKLFNISK